MTEADAIVFVVDDDASVRQSLKNLIRAISHSRSAHSRPLPASRTTARTGCFAARRVRPITPTCPVIPIIAYIDVYSLRSVRRTSAARSPMTAGFSARRRAIPIRMSPMRRR